MIDSLSKFKRLFVFGCSYTNYSWPTWADILSKSIDAEYYNFGRVGSGNQFIALRVSEASKRFNFTETDLVITMWTSTAREDRYLNGVWTGEGNIYNQSLYSKDFVKKFADPEYYTIRDNGLINLCIGYLKYLGCAHINLFAWSINQSILSTDVTNQCKTLYDIAETMPLDDFRNSKVKTGYDIMRDGNMVNDGHPGPMMHYDYLKTLGFNLSESSKIYAETAEKSLLKVKDFGELKSVFPECVRSNLEGMFG
jgi:hypothetical protein